MAEEVDVLIVGAGLSGIGAAWHLRQECPDSSFLILEGRDDIGGTWDIFRYPGIRSDSDMFTLGYDFKPWRGGKVLADGPAIREYLRETVEEGGIQERIRFGHLVKRADWDSEAALWTVTAEERASGDEREFRCRMLYMCAGYYSYRQGYTPDFPGMQDFQGRLIHPQFWPEDLDYSGKRVLVIGSGATAVTLVPAMADTAAQVTMLQRSPTYMVNRPEYDPVGKWLKRLLPERAAYRTTRWLYFRVQWLTYTWSRIWPRSLKRLLINRARAQLPPEYDVETHFTPRYNPWDERLCAVPENDFFKSIAAGNADVVTDRIERFTPSGVQLESGRELEADIVVTATGLQLVMAGEVQFSVDGAARRLGDSFTYKGMMFSDVPNLVNTWGYINYSWTLRADLTARFVCRLVQHLDRSGMRQVTPRLRPGEEDMPRRLFVSEFSAGYFARAEELLPKQGDRDPWLNCQNYGRERSTIGRATLEDGVLQFDNPAPQSLAQAG